MGFRFRLTVTIVLLIAITFSLGGTVLIFTSFRMTRSAEIDRSLDRFQNVFNMVDLISRTNEKMKPAELGLILSQLTGQSADNWQAAELTVDGEAVWVSGKELLGRAFPADQTRDQCAYQEVTDDAGNGLLVESRMTAGKQELALRGRFDLSNVYRHLKNQQKIFIFIYSTVLLFSVMTATALSYALTAKLRRLTAAVKKISAGSLGTRSNIRSGDEFGLLSRNFDTMADRLEQNIGQLEANIQQQETFMGNFAHELKTPMTSIIGFADLLRQGNLDESTRMMAAQYIYSEGKRLERLSFKLLDLLLLKKDKIQMRAVSISSFAAAVDQAMTPALRQKGIRFICRSGNVTAYLEPDLVKSLLYNLIDNASKAIEKDGILVLKAEQAEDGVIFDVIDNGRGMEKEQLGKITEAFYRVDKARSRAQGGAGLGLALCKKIVELHSGSISFNSVPGRGTAVRVHLCGKAPTN